MKIAALDIETLGTRTDSVVFEVGVACMNHVGSLTKFTVLLNPNYQHTNLERFIEPSTMDFHARHRSPEEMELLWDAINIAEGNPTNTLQKWCSYQSVASKLGPVFYASRPVHLHEILYPIVSDAERIWINGPDFDMRILTHLFESENLGELFPFRFTRDVRTALDIPEIRAKWRPQKPTNHLAVEDAYWNLNIGVDYDAFTRGIL